MHYSWQCFNWQGYTKTLKATKVDVQLQCESNLTLCTRALHNTLNTTNINILHTQHEHY